MFHIEKTVFDKQKQLVVTISPTNDSFSSFKHRAAREMSQDVNIPGFRSGKAPLSTIIDHVDNPLIINKAAKMFVEEVYPTLLNKLSIAPDKPRGPIDIQTYEPLTIDITIQFSSPGKRKTPPASSQPTIDTIPFLNSPTLIRRRMLARLGQYFDNQYRDPALLYLGGRYALSLGWDAEARRLLEELSSLLSPENKLPEDTRKFREKYLPTNNASALPCDLLLLLATDQEEERQEIRTRLQEHAEGDTRLADLLEAEPQDPSENLSPPPEDLATLSKQARTHYEANELVSARSVLESMIMLDGDQPAVFRNLITVTSEQQDIEAYERYWRRYVKLLLWRMIRADDLTPLWQELMQFYIQVAEATDRFLDGTQDEIQETITRPGFLPRWLEAHAGLIWLESALKSHRRLQTNLGKQHIQNGLKGNLSLMRHWIQLFYPEFEMMLDLGTNNNSSVLLPTREIKLHIYFDPSQRILTRFLEWHRFGFGLDTQQVINEDTGQEEQKLLHNRHAENIVALASCVTRIPTHHYTKDLHQAIEENHQAGVEKSPREVIWDACGLPFFQFRLSTYLEQDPPDWAGIVTFFGNQDMLPKLDPTLRLFLAMAYCNCENPIKGLDVACEAVPDIPETKFDEESQSYNLWVGVLNANCEHAISAEKKPGQSVPGKDPTQTTAPELWMGLVKHKIQQMSGEEHIREFQEEALELVEAIYHQRVLVDKAVEESQALVSEHKFNEALKVIADLPDSPSELKEIKNELTQQIEEAQQGYELETQIEKAIEASKRHVKKGNFTQARKVVNQLPDSPENIKKIKKDLIEQISDAEKHSNLQDKIEKAIEKSRTHVENGNFRKARTLVRSLPNSPDEVKELKENLLTQIDEAEQQAGIHKKIDEAIQQSRELVHQGKFSRARRKIRRLPDAHPEVKELKRELLSQIDEAEKEMSKITQSIDQMEELLKLQGINMDHIDKIAKDNDVDTSNPGDYYALLKAIVDQLL